MTTIVRKRFTFKCWHCHRTYTLLREVEGQPVLNVQCPYCYSAGVVPLAPYRRKTVKVFRDGKPTPEDAATAWEFPEVLPTIAPDAPSPERS